MTRHNSIEMDVYDAEEGNFNDPTPKEHTILLTNRHLHIVTLFIDNFDKIGNYLRIPFHSPLNSLKRESVERDGV